MRLQTDQTVLRWVAASLGLENSTFASSCEPTEFDWSWATHVLFTHRLAVLALPALRIEDVAIPDDVAAQIKRFSTLTLRMNTANLLSMRAILPLFEAAGIQLAVFKGPVVQQLVYGTPFARPSSDIDLLVAPADFQRSRPILEAAAYDLAAECHSFWWRVGLGEQHFLGRGPAATTVDLHHRVQQPGCPLPRFMGSLISDRMTVKVASQTIATFSPIHSHLLMAMSFVKALHHREPAARYVVDFVAYGAKQSPTHWTDLLYEARRQGLENTVALTLRVCHLLFPGQSTLPPPSARVLPALPDAVLWDMTLHPSLEGLAWPKRRTLLHALYDRKFEYPVGFGIMAGSELLRYLAVSTKRSEIAQPT